MALGSASIAYARATSRSGKAYVSRPQPSIAVRMRSGLLPKARATTSR
jgi:hypothetical protein